MKEREIVEAAVKVFSDKGIMATMSEIAAQAGVQENVIYKSGYSKDSILLSIYDFFWEKLIKEAEAIKSNEWAAHSIEKLKNLMVVMIQFMIKDQDLIKVISKCSLAYPEAYQDNSLREKRLEIRRKNRNFLSIIDEIIKKGQDLGEIRSEKLKPQVARQIFMGSFLFVAYGLFVQFDKDEPVSYSGQEAQDGLFQLIDILKKPSDS